MVKYADLRKARFWHTNLSYADLRYADFTNAYMGFTSFGWNDLSKVKGLEKVLHEAPSTLGMDTIYRSDGNIPESFLRGVGLSDEFIPYIHSLIVQPIQFYSCFISYSSKDQKFADRLYADLQAKGVRCWFAPEDLKIGDKTRTKIDESIKVYDKLLLILSKHSVESDWVEKEVETALEKERDQKRAVLFPIRLDDTVMKLDSGWPADIKRTRHIGDFRQWKAHERYQKSFSRLLHDLKAVDAR